MNKKRSLLISIFITVFLVVIAGGIASTVLANNQARQPEAMSAADAVSTYQAREAEYRSLLDKANQQLELANQQITALAGASAQNAQNQAGEASQPVTVEMAKTIAFQLARDYPLEDPTLVDYNGTVAYEVKFRNGTIYVDANSGEILFNGLSQPSVNISADQAVKAAVAYAGNSNVEDVSIGSYNGSRVYLVAFSNGQQVYVSLSGQIVAVKLPPASTSLPSHESEHESAPESPEEDD